MKIDKKMFVCNECLSVFEVHNMRKNKPYCVGCGDHVSVQRVVKDVEERRDYKVWTDEEITLLDKCIDGELKPYVIANMFSRSISSVKSKIQQRVKGMTFKEGFTADEYLRLWKELGDDYKVAEHFHISHSYLQLLKRERGIVVRGEIKEKREKLQENRIKLNNEMKERGLDSYRIYPALGFGNVRTYWNWRATTRKRGYDLI